jgi:hypothetical protein
MFLVITLLNGSEVRINPREIVSMIEARDADDPMKRYTAEVRCVVETTDGKNYTTREECPSIEARVNTLVGAHAQEMYRGPIYKGPPTP